MDTRTVTLSEFLLARIGEDEAAATSASHHSQLVHDYERDNYGFLWVKTTRVVAECEAKRRIVEASRSYHQSDEDPDPDDPDGGWALSIALRALALPYADHPDYDEAWRP